jgi:hypothetical protein
MPSTAQREATVSVEVFVVQSIHIAQRPVQNDGAAEVDAMPCIDTVLRHRKLIRLFETDMCPLCSLHLVSVHLPVWPMYTLSHSHGIRYMPGTFKPKLSLTDLSICVVFFHGI